MEDIAEKGQTVLTSVKGIGSERLWEEVKKRYPIGVYVQGEYSYSYPQGSIIRGNDFMAIYKGKDPFCLHQVVQYRVKLYDDMNMWLIVE